MFDAYEKIPKEEQGSPKWTYWYKSDVCGSCRYIPCNKIIDEACPICGEGNIERITVRALKKLSDFRVFGVSLEHNIDYEVKE